MPDLTLINAVKHKLDATLIVALTLWAECRNERLDGQIAVANVIRNRVEDAKSRWPRTYTEVCLQPWQFSCWIPEGGASNHAALAKLVDRCLVGFPALPKQPRVQTAWWIAHGVINTMLPDNVSGANHYYNPRAVTTTPEWATGPTAKLTAEIGHHLFFQL